MVLMSRTYARDKALKGKIALVAGGTRGAGRGIAGRGMQYQALAAERYLADGRTDSDVLPIDETVAIMATLDEIRALVGVRYPGEE